MLDGGKQHSMSANRRLAEALARRALDQRVKQAALESATLAHKMFADRLLQGPVPAAQMVAGQQRAAVPPQELPFANHILGTPSPWSGGGGGVDIPRDVVPPSEEMEKFIDDLMRGIEQLPKGAPPLRPQQPQADPPSPRRPMPPPLPGPLHRPRTRMLADTFLR